MSNSLVFSTMSDSVYGQLSIDGANPSNSFMTVTAGVIGNLQVVLNEGQVNDPGTLTIALYSNSGTGTPPTGPSPVSLLTTLATLPNSSIPVNSSGGQAVDFAVSSAYTLTAGTRYWIVLEESLGSQATVAFTATDMAYPAEYNSYSYLSGGVATAVVARDSSPSGPYLMSVEMASISTACFAAHTHILTALGELPVQSLSVGCPIAVREGGFKPLKWLGRRRVNCSSLASPSEAWPIRVEANAFGRGHPSRDLLLSPDHAIYCDAKGGQGVLIPVRYLVNGATIRQIQTDVITYYHVELDEHSVIIADGLTVESYLDTGNRAAFENSSCLGMQDADFAFAVWEKSACAPLVLDGDRLAAVRSWLIKESLLGGDVQTSEPDVHLVLDGTRLEGEKVGRKYTFDLPEGTGVVSLVTRNAVPFEIYPSASDTRRLGVLVSAALLDGIDLLPACGTGWHSPEPEGRWTDGSAELDCTGGGRLEVVVVWSCRYWTTRVGSRDQAPCPAASPETDLPEVGSSKVCIVEHETASTRKIWRAA